jgi:hypothetical protein
VASQINSQRRPPGRPLPIRRPALQSEQDDVASRESTVNPDAQVGVAVVARPCYLVRNNHNGPLTSVLF